MMLNISSPRLIFEIISKQTTSRAHFTSILILLILLQFQSRGLAFRLIMGGIRLHEDCHLACIKWLFIGVFRVNRYFEWIVAIVLFLNSEVLNHPMELFQLTLSRLRWHVLLSRLVKVFEVAGNEVIYILDLSEGALFGFMIWTGLVLKLNCRVNIVFHGVFSDRFLLFFVQNVLRGLMLGSSGLVSGDLAEQHVDLTHSLLVVCFNLLLLKFKHFVLICLPCDLLLLHAIHGLQLSDSLVQLKFVEVEV